MNASDLRRIVLVGDSVFDNTAYVESGKSVPELLQKHVGSEYVVINRAVDGATVEMIDARRVFTKEISPETDIVVLSVGGNDVLDNVDFLADTGTYSPLEFLSKLHERVRAFEKPYIEILEAARQLTKLQLIGCTIYEPVIDEFPQTAVSTGIAIFNEAIMRRLHRYGRDWIELRDVCYEREHFTSVIEPSEAGGEAIALAIAHTVAHQKAAR